MGELEFKGKITVNGKETPIEELNTNMTDDFSSSDNDVVNHTIPIKQCKGKIVRNNECCKLVRLTNKIKSEVDKAKRSFRIYKRVKSGRLKKKLGKKVYGVFYNQFESKNNKIK